MQWGSLLEIQHPYSQSIPGSSHYYYYHMTGWSNTEDTLLAKHIALPHWFMKYFLLQLCFQITNYVDKKRHNFWNWSSSLMAAILHCAMTDVSQCQNRTIIEFPVKKYTEKKYYKGIYLNFFISYNFSIVSGGHFRFLQTKHDWSCKTKKTLNELRVKN